MDKVFEWFPQVKMNAHTQTILTEKWKEASNKFRGFCYLSCARRIGEIWAWVVILGWLESRATVQRWLLRIFVKTKIKDRSLSKAGNWLELGSGVVRRQRLGFYASAPRTLLHKILSEPPQSKITAPWKPIDQTQVILRWDKMVYWQTESQKPRQRVSNADRKVFANPESFATSSLLAGEFPNILGNIRMLYKISR